MYQQYVEQQIRRNEQRVNERRMFEGNRGMCLAASVVFLASNATDPAKHLLYRPLRMTIRRTLYHQTSPEAATSILQSGVMLPGSQGRAGPGIYFAFDATDTFRKALRHGAVLEVDVAMGKCMDCGATPPTPTEVTLFLFDGYDSVTYVTETGPELVVYHSDQCVPIKRIVYLRMNHIVYRANMLRFRTSATHSS